MAHAGPTWSWRTRQNREHPPDERHGKCLSLTQQAKAMANLFDKCETFRFGRKRWRLGSNRFFWFVCIIYLKRKIVILNTNLAYIPFSQQQAQISKTQSLSIPLNRIAYRSSSLRSNESQQKLLISIRSRLILFTWWAAQETPVLDTTSQNFAPMAFS